MRAHSFDGGRLAASEELTVFVRDALLRGLPRDQIRSVLGKAGWRIDQIDDAVGAYAEIDYPIPVPMPKPYLSARDAFMYLLLFTTLYIAAFNLGDLVFQWIDHAFPGAPATTTVHGDRAFLAGVRWSLAALIITVPIYLFIGWRLRRAIARDPAKRASKVRKWLTYLTLFVASITLIGDCTSLVANFLGGQAPVRFLLKVATIAAIAGAIFVYYLRDLRSEETERKP
jgi:hypothetical protein